MMNFKLLVISGTSCAGKSFITNKFIRQNIEYELVKSFTTRKSRNDDSGNYTYVSEDDFNKIKDNNELLTNVYYLGHNYGIKLSDVYDIINNNKIPILIIAPSCLNQVKKNFGDFPSVFFDAENDILKERLIERNKKFGKIFIKQITEDRKYKNEYNYTINNDNLNIEILIKLLNRLLLNFNSGGLVDGELIKLLTSCNLLIIDHEKKNIKGASYDISLGEEYYHDGQLKKLSKDNGFIILSPGDFAIVKSKEWFCLPNDIAGRFDLKVNMFFQGLILSNGPQIDPGFEGRLFCLLFNPSSDIIQLKYGQSFATIEFVKLLKPTFKYHGKYQSKESIHDYLPKMIKRSSIVEIFDDIKVLKKNKFYEKSLPIVISLISLIAVLIEFIFNPFSNIDNTVETKVKQELKKYSLVKDSSVINKKLPNQPLKPTADSNAVFQ